MRSGRAFAGSLSLVALAAALLAGVASPVVVASSLAAKPRTFSVSIVGTFDYSYVQPSCSPAKVRSVVRFTSTTGVVAKYAGGRLTVSRSLPLKAAGTAALFATTATNAVTRTLDDQLPACAAGATNVENACVIGTPRPIVGARALLRLVAPTGSGSPRGGFATDPNFQIGVEVLGRHSKIEERPRFAAGCTGSLRAAQKEVAEYEITGCRATRAGEPLDGRCARIRPAQFASAPVGRAITASAVGSGSSQETTDGVTSTATYEVTWTVRFQRLS